MVSNKIAQYVVNKNETIADAYWKFSREYKITIVVDNDNKFLGIVGNAEYENAKKTTSPKEKIETITNKNCKKIVYNDGTDIYMEARNIYAECNLNYIPIVSDNDIIDIFNRERAFYKQYFSEGRLPRMHYSVCMWAAAEEAKRMGYDAISVIEFGVASGNGLLAAQAHAKEISRLFGIRIELYGFDTGTGLPESSNLVNDMGNIFAPGCFTMNQKTLSMQLEEHTHLILGNIEDTIGDFAEKYNAPPVGAMFVDVDYYSSTKPILNWLGQNDKYFMPRIFMYFDDISALQEGLGEEKAIIEFNAENEGNIKISPEKVSGNIDWIAAGYYANSSWIYNCTYDYARPRLKICHRYNHKDYTKYRFSDDEKAQIEARYSL